VAPEVARNIKGDIEIRVPDDNVQVFYTTDESHPDKTARRYQEALPIKEPTRIKAIAYDPVADRYSAVTHITLDIPKTDWTLHNISSGNKEEAGKIIDEDPSTWWASDRNGSLPQEVVLDLGKEYTLTGFQYNPPRDRWSFGIISHYEFLVSPDGTTWSVAASGEFGNIKNNPIEQTVPFSTQKGRYIKLRGIRTADGSNAISFGEIGVLTQ